MTTTRIGYLGPKGSYSHQAAHSVFCDSELEPKSTIHGVFSALAALDFGVVPQENTTYGAVVDTYDALRAGNCFVCGEVTIEIQHCLLVKQGTTSGEIQVIMSHEQALGQCQTYLREHYPNARLVKSASTSAAAEALLDGPPGTAAIASKVCAEIYAGLDVLQENIQDGPHNYTRFYVITTNISKRPPSTQQPNKALLCISSFKASGLPSILLALDLSIARLDRRPNPKTGLFDDLYFVEVREELEKAKSRPWKEQLDSAIHRLHAIQVEAHMAGIW